MIDCEELDCLIPLKFSPTCACLDSCTRLPQPCSSGPLPHRAIANVPLPGCQKPNAKKRAFKDLAARTRGSRFSFERTLFTVASLEDVVQADAKRLLLSCNNSRENHRWSQGRGSLDTLAANSKIKRCQPLACLNLRLEDA
jgi:hypothetical protein